MTRAGTGFAALAAILSLAGGAQAAESRGVPAFLADGVRFVRDAALCDASGSGGESGIEGTLEIGEGGIFGYELGCRFIGFSPVPALESGEIYAWVAAASCGDDSGISRPDNFTLIFNQDSNALTVQSQNEYVIGEMLAMTQGGESASADTLSADFLSGEYTLCPTH